MSIKIFALLLLELERSKREEQAMEPHWYTIIFITCKYYAGGGGGVEGTVPTNSREGRVAAVVTTRSGEGSAAASANSGDGGKAGR